MSLASTTITESKFDQHRVVSFEKPSGTWTITAPPLTQSRNYICIFPTGALKTEGVASRAKGAIHALIIWSEWRLTVIAATVRIALVDILDLSEVDIPAGGFLYPAVGWG